MRNLLKYKFISFINLFGLTVGLTCCLLIVTYIINELSYDKSFKNSQQVYRVTRDFYTQDGVVNLRLSSVAPPFGSLLQHEFPDIQNMTRVLFNESIAVRYEDKMFLQPSVAFADEHFFDFFSVPIIKGDARTGLVEPKTVMLSEATAKKYFGSIDPVNKFIHIDNTLDCKVTGVFHSFPVNAHMHPEILVSFSTLRDSAVYGEKQLETNWGNNAFFTYLMFPANYPVEKIQAQFPAFLNKHMHFPGEPPGMVPSKGTSLALQKLTDIHLRSHFDDEIEANGDIKRIYIFSAIALFILIIACINYMNLSTARAALRAREIGIRKAVGAERKSIIAQFLTESVMITSMAFILAVGLVWALLPLVNSFTNQHFSMSALAPVQIMLPLALLALIVGLISGIYPALFMSSFRPVAVLKGMFKAGKGSISFRKVLVVAQFAISIILIIATTVVFQQLRYMQKASLGYDRSQIITMPIATSINNSFDPFRDELLKQTGIRGVARSSRIPTGRLLDDAGVQLMSGNSLRQVDVALKYVAADYDFIPTFGIKLVAGRNFSREYALDTSNFIINETAASVLGWRGINDAVGKDIVYGGVKGKVIGVMHDFNFESLHQRVVPMILFLPGKSSAGQFNKVAVKIEAGHAEQAIAALQDTWKKYAPNNPLQFDFLDERYSKLYDSEKEQGRLFTVFAIIAIFIACLGLFGLSAFTIAQRIKEIGIRKVLGASVPEIVRVLSVDFLKLVLIASVIAFPVAWMAMHKWLGDFAYRISIGWWVLIGAGLLAATIAFVTISVQAIRAALANPVKSLRTE